MKPGITVIILSHNKPSLVKQAIASVIDQTYKNWEAILMDSGILYDKGFFNDITDKRIKLLRSDETEEDRKTKLMPSVCFNKILNSNLINGDLILYLCDDDLYLTEAFETFYNAYNFNKMPQAMYSSQYTAVVDDNGLTYIKNIRPAMRPAGEFCGGGQVDCVIDYLQFCHTKEILEKYKEIYKTNKYHSEDKKDRAHADGIFMTMIGRITTIYNIPLVLSVNRRSSVSANKDIMG